MNLVLPLLFAIAAFPQANAESTPQASAADKPLVSTAVVNAPVSEVWRAWTTSEGITKWMVPAGEVDLRIGGALRTSYTKGSDLKGPDTIVNTILAFDPERMLTIKNTQSPARFPFKKAMENAWTVIYLEPIDKDHTRVIVRMLGFTGEAESVEMRKFFAQGNQMTVDALAKLFAKK